MVVWWAGRLSAVVAAAAAAGAGCCYSELLRQLLTAVGLVSVVSVGAVLCWAWRLPSGQRCHARPELAVGLSLRLLRRRLCLSHGVSPTAAGDPPGAGDSALDQLLWRLVCRLVDDYFSGWYGELAFDCESQVASVRLVTWRALCRLRRRLAAVDAVRFVGRTVASQLRLHFQLAKLAGAGADGRDTTCSATCWPLCDEQQFLLDVAEVLLLVALPPDDDSCCPLLRSLLQQVLACKVLLPAFNYVCDPHFLNCRLLEQLRRVKLTRTTLQRTYCYAASYEDFIRMIRLSSDAQELLQIRCSIAAEIAQASAINSLKRARGLELARDSRPRGASKGELLHARNLQRYINQLTFAKTQCEKRMLALGCRLDTVTSPAGSAELADDTAACGRRVLAFSVILQAEYTRRYFRRHLQAEQQQQALSLLDFWTRVNHLRTVTPPQAAHSLAAEIYRTYLSGDRAVLKVNQAVLKNIEGFLVSNRDPGVFFELQEEAQRQLELNHYHRFLVSPLYNRMMVNAEEAGIDFINATVATDSPTGGAVAPAHMAGLPVPDTSAAATSVSLADHSSFASLKLDQLNARIASRTLALQALGALDERQSRHLSLERELSALREERVEWQAHLQRTDLWRAHAGQWRVDVHSAEVLADRDAPVFVLVVYLVSHNCEQQQQGEEGEAAAGNTGPADTALQNHRGWIVIRQLSEVQCLHARLCRLLPRLKRDSKGPPSPPPARLFGRGCDSSYLERAKAAVQAYLARVLSEPQLLGSDSLYTFLSPSAGRLLLPALASNGRQGVLSLLRHMARAATSGHVSKSPPVEADTEEDSAILDEALAAGAGAAGSDPTAAAADAASSASDDLVEPLYALISEVFELSGKWLRKTLVSFVQLAYGQTISRRLAVVIADCCSSHQLLSHLSLVSEALWPNPDLCLVTEGASSFPGPSSEAGRDREAVCREARQLLLELLPEPAVHVLGEETARRGVSRVFDTMQRAPLNKRLLCCCVEKLLEELSSDHCLSD